MSIRLKQLVLLLGIALIPVTLSGWQSLRQIDHMARGIAESTRTRVQERDMHYMREKVADIGTALQLTSRATESFLRSQRRVQETALEKPVPGQDSRIIYSQQVATLADSVEDERFSRTNQAGQSTYVRVNFQHPSFLLADQSCVADCTTAIAQLASISAELRDIFQRTANFSLWHYTGLENGVAMAYPAHGDYPQDYDPRQRPWYKSAVAAGTMNWSPLTIDASTGQPVLTAATPLRSPDGKIIGVTAIDLPLRQLLNFHSSAAPWLNVARLALVQLDDNATLQVVAMKEPLQVGSDWRSNQQTRTISAIDAATVEQLRKLALGESLLIDNVDIDNIPYSTALTAMNNEGSSWLALASPHSAVEKAVADALLVVENERRDTLQSYAIGTLILLALVIVIALYFANRVTAPLIRMSKTATDLAEGKLASRTGIQRNDEIGNLSTSIDRMADSIEQLQLEQEEAYRSMIMSLTRALEKKNSYTAGHSGRVTRNALKLGEHIGLDAPTMEKLRFGALTHDLGKIGIEDAILNKPAPLNEAEYVVMKQHPAFSKTIMKPLVRFEEYAEIAGSHHEHWDGSGYPEGLAGEEIHLLARIVAIADAWDAMVGDRIYRKGMSIETALDILDREKDGGQFDPRLIRAFIELMREERASA
jgi:HD-GYP domain-containing protein (c-di-GMP phosphodiesterase class II)